MKTSTSQFELMVTFMEHHGDLSKPQNTSRGRVTTHVRWDELVSLLNSDGSGDTRTNERWKKVWSDYKNNAKKKAARIHKAATGTGGGPAVYSKLSDLELRVLALVGVEKATGLGFEEAGVPQEAHVELNVIEIPQPTPDPTCISTPASTNQVVCETSTEQLWNTPGPSWVYQSPPRPTTYHAISPPLLHMAEEIVQNTELLSPTLPANVPAPPPQPAPAGPATPHRARRRLQRSSRRRERPADHFLRSDGEWRNFRIQQHRETMAVQAEQNRIKELEIAEVSRRKEIEIQEVSRRKEVDLQIHREWTAVALAAIQVLDKVANKL